MNENMTAISRGMFESATSREMSVREAVAMLEECAKFRKFSDKLGAFAKGRDLRSLLTEGLLANNPTAKRDSIDKKVRNWLADRQSSISKTDAIELCFVLGLTLSEADAFVAMVSDEGLHWRNPEELVYIYALDRGMTYTEAKKLYGDIMNRIAIAEDSENVSPDSFTSVIRAEVGQLDSVDELTEYIISAEKRLGKMHNSAYAMFNEMMDHLESPELEDWFETDRKYTCGEIVRYYLHKNELPDVTDKANQNAMSAIQRSIAANWPSESALSRMKNRHVDVNRKVMMLLFLATYDVEEDLDTDEFYDLPDPDSDGDEAFREFYQKMNSMLEYCGFSPIDPRAPFDWMILYCLCGEDIYELDSQLSDFLSDLFRDFGNDLQD
ncbi:MAG: hypothetical protein E7628_07475 [Ruminococcaceae bacterium]|nr:hypothetical protein [Oscillospiraceae bacterium]